ncbi:DMT family transporter [Williamsia sp.]|uniref:DMT family transporter n=1 Tax=Williamsia sp. TaxID=1872085 RepID=UPI001A2D88A7|nr:DMT family transporter [Williamsia sp.]MBJ7287848.1 DMT family transporter [Williamsia sp.]
MHLFLPASLALVSALFVAVGTLVRQRSSTATGGITRRWWYGVALAAIGFALQAVALGMGTLLLVQPLIVLSVLFALPLEAYLDHRRLNFQEWKWGIVLTLCIAAFVLITMPQPGKHQVEPAVLAGTIVVVVVVLGGLVVFARRVSSHYRALLFGSASGLLTGVQSFLLKGVVTQLGDKIYEPLLHPELYLILCVAAASVYAQQLAFAAHDLQTSFPAMTVMEPAVAMALGVLLLGERAQVDWFEGIVVAAVLVQMFYAVLVLAQHAAARETEFDKPPELVGATTSTAHAKRDHAH